MTRDEAVDDWRRSDGPTSVIINVPRVEFDIVNLLLSNDLLQACQRRFYCVLLGLFCSGFPSPAKLLPATLQSCYLPLRKVGVAGNISIAGTVRGICTVSVRCTVSVYNLSGARCLSGARYLCIICQVHGACKVHGICLSANFKLLQYFWNG